MSLTDYLPMRPAPWPPYRELPDDVIADITYVAYEEMLSGRLLRLRLRGGEEVRVVESLGTDLNAEVVQAVRKVQQLRAQAALDAAGEITDPVVAGMALTLLDMAATRQTGCKCCGTFAEGGCVLPPGADVNDPNYRCEYVNANGEQCRCWGGPDRECEDCWLSSK